MKEQTALYEVLDIPSTATADDAAWLLNEPEERGMNIHSVLDWRGVNGTGARIILKRRGYAQRSPRTHKPTGADEERAMRFVRGNRELSVRQLEAALKALGFPRSPTWIAAKRAEAGRSQARET